METAAAAAKRRRYNEDRISQLPDDILISIICRLTLQEATATSILSTRWRYLCTYITCLNFPPCKPEIVYFRKYREIQEKEFPNYINMINHTLDSHKGGRIKEFRVNMYCLEGPNIERWLEFALARKVEIIEINMRFLRNTRHVRYSLQPFNLIGTKDGQPLLGLKCLRELSLSSFHAHDGEVELLLSNFPLLESLCIVSPRGLKNILIEGHSLFLKHLGISGPCDLESIEIGNMMNLVSLKCFRLPSTYVLRLYNIPKLIEFSTSDQSENTLSEVLPRIPSCILDQLQLLKLSTDPYFIRGYLPTHMLPKLINIKHLKVELDACKNSAFTYALCPLLEACCSLEKFETKFLWCSSRCCPLEKFEIKFSSCSSSSIKFKQEKQKEIIVCPPEKKLSPNLKKLKLSGYLGGSSLWELKLAFFIMKNVAALEEMIVEPYGVNESMRQMTTARARQHFLPTTPDSVKLVII